MSMRRFSVILLVLALFGPSCRGCRRASNVHVTALIARDADAVMLVESLDAAVKGSEAFLTHLVRRSGGKMLQQARAGLKNEMKLDPLDVASYDAWGIDTRGGLALFTEGQQEVPLLAVPVKDFVKFDMAFKAWLASSDGASKLKDETVGLYTLHMAGRAFGSEVAPAMYWAEVQGFALITRAEGRQAMQEALTRLAKRAQAKDPVSFASDPVSMAMRAKVPAGIAQVFVRGGTVKLGEAGKLTRGSMTSITLSTDGISSDTFVSLAVPGLDKLAASPAPQSLADRIEADALVYGMSRAVHAETLAVLRADATVARVIDRNFASAAKETGLDIEKEVLPLLGGPVTFSVYLTDGQGLAGQMQKRPTLNSLLDVVHVVVTAEIKDAEGMKKLLVSSRQALEKRGVRLATRSLKVGDRDVTAYGPVTAQSGAEPKLGWAVMDNLYVYAAGTGRLQRALDTIAKTSGRTSLQLDGVAGDVAKHNGTHVAVARFAALADAVSGAGSSTPAGFESTVSAVTNVLRTFGNLVVAMRIEPDGVRLLVREKLE